LKRVVYLTGIFMCTFINHIRASDRRFALKPGEGSDSVHSDPVYAYAVCELHSDGPHTGVGLAFTLGAGNEMVCNAINLLGEALQGREIEELMASFGVTYKELSNHHQLRWLGPHKGVVQLALAAIVNSCFDLWAKSRGVPLWRLLLDLSPEQLVALLDLSYLEDVLPASTAIEMLRSELPSRKSREGVLSVGYPGYDTSVGWFHYSDQEIQKNARRAVSEGFTAIKLKIGSADGDRDVRRARLVREAVGDDVRVMVDCNQQWTLPRALKTCLQLADMNPYWIEEPTHPDDVTAHQTLARAIAPLKLALGEHVPNAIVFKNYLQAQAASFIQVDCVRVGGISEFLAVSLMCRLFGIPVVPHVGDMGQIHQHLVLFNHIAMGHEKIFLEYIPHLREYFAFPARVEGGVYCTPQEPGSSSDLIALPTKTKRTHVQLAK
jgi:L-fuconate dehydratase